jgi:hypothetical protein
MNGADTPIPIDDWGTDIASSAGGTLRSRDESDRENSDKRLGTLRAYDGSRDGTSPTELSLDNPSRPRYA